jgi:hypothetical protein
LPAPPSGSASGGTHPWRCRCCLLAVFLAPAAQAHHVRQTFNGGCVQQPAPSSGSARCLAKSFETARVVAAGLFRSGEVAPSCRARSCRRVRSPVPLRTVEVRRPRFAALSSPAGWPFLSVPFADCPARRAQQALAPDRGKRSRSECWPCTRRLRRHSSSRVIAAFRLPPQEKRIRWTDKHLATPAHPFRPRCNRCSCAIDLLRQ